MKKKKGYECHHAIPVSLMGPNWKENTFNIPKASHKIIHDNLDIPYALVRKFRLRTNHLAMKPDQRYLQELERLHTAYFARFELLPHYLQKKHVIAMSRTVVRFMKEHEVEYKYKVSHDLAKQFRQHLAAYHQLHYIYLGIEKVTILK